MTGGIELHQWVADYNWDNGLAPIWPIVESKETEFGTALMIYWRLEGPYLETRSHETNRLHAAVKERLLAGYYRVGTIPYDPVADNQISKTQLYNLKKSGIPKELIDPYDPKPSS